MKIEKKWSVGSKSDEIARAKELTNIAGQWNVNIEVSITKPYIYSRGPVEKIIISEEIHEHHPFKT